MLVLLTFLNKSNQRGINVGDYLFIFERLRIF